MHKLYMNTTFLYLTLTLNLYNSNVPIYFGLTYFDIYPDYGTRVRCWHVGLAHP